MAGDPVPAISESEARDDDARLFEDIRRVLGVPVVNLIFRHIATLPACLPWSWGVLRPLYASGQVLEASGRLGVNRPLPAIGPVTREGLRRAGVDAKGEAGIVRILDSYDRSNAMNLVALTGLLDWLRAGTPARQAPGASEPRLLRPGEPAIGEPLPPLIAPDDMDEATRALVLELNAFGERGDGRVLVSMYRHLAHWPGYLELAAGLLRPLHADSRLARLVDEALGDARIEARRLGPWVAPEGVPAPVRPARDHLEQALAGFTSNTISKMVPAVRLLRAALPAPAPDRA